MAFSFFAADNKRGLLQSFGLLVTGTLSRYFPRFSSYIGYKLLLATHAPKHTRFDKIQPDQQFSLDSRAGQFSVYVFGQGKKVALVSHGWGDNSSRFEQLIESLLKQGFKVVTLDHIGHGRSDGKHSHLPSFIESLELTISHFEKQGDTLDTLIGHSMGGIAILNLPEMVLQNSKIFLISIPINFFSIMFETIERVGLSRRLLKTVLESITPKYGKTWLELQTENHLHKLNDRIVFIHDENDRLAPFQDTVDLANKVKATLIRTQGLGHRRIVSDTGVIELIRANIAAT